MKKAKAVKSPSGKFRMDGVEYFSIQRVLQETGLSQARLYQLMVEGGPLGSIHVGLGPQAIPAKTVRAFLRARAKVAAAQAAVALPPGSAVE